MWLNAVEGFFSIITRRKILQGAVKSVGELKEAIRDDISKHNGQAKTFIWTKTDEVFVEKLSRLPTHNM
jgi:hypothetical protein